MYQRYTQDVIVRESITHARKTGRWCILELNLSNEPLCSPMPSAGTLNRLVELIRRASSNDVVLRRLSGSVNGLCQSVVPTGCQVLSVLHEGTTARIRNEGANRRPIPTGGPIWPRGGGVIGATLPPAQLV